MHTLQTCELVGRNVELVKNVTTLQHDTHDTVTPDCEPHDPTTVTTDNRDRAVGSLHLVVRSKKQLEYSPSQAVAFIDGTNCRSGLANNCAVGGV